MKIIQTKDSNSNNCDVKAWWQNELVVETTYTCRTFNSDLALYTAVYTPLHGEIRSFSYIKNCQQGTSDEILIATKVAHLNSDWGSLGIVV